MCIVEVMAAGPTAIDRRNSTMAAFAELIAQAAAAELPKSKLPPALTAETLVEIYEVVYTACCRGAAMSCGAAARPSCSRSCSRMSVGTPPYSLLKNERRRSKHATAADRQTPATPSLRHRMRGCPPAYRPTGRLLRAGDHAVRRRRQGRSPALERLSAELLDAGATALGSRSRRRRSQARWTALSVTRWWRPAHVLRRPRRRARRRTDHDTRTTIERHEALASVPGVSSTSQPSEARMLAHFEAVAGARPPLIT